MTDEFTAVDFGDVVLALRDGLLANSMSNCSAMQEHKFDPLTAERLVERQLEHLRRANFFVVRAKPKVQLQKTRSCDCADCVRGSWHND